MIPRTGVSLRVVAAAWDGIDIADTDIIATKRSMVKESIFFIFSFHSFFYESVTNVTKLKLNGICSFHFLVLIWGA